MKKFTNVAVSLLLFIISFGNTNTRGVNPPDKKAEKDLIISQFPYIQTFDSTFIPIGWSSRPEDWGYWYFGRRDKYGLEGTGGNYAYAGYDFASLFSPTFDFSRADSISLIFTHYFFQRMWTGANLNISTDGGENWAELLSWDQTTFNPTYVQISLDFIAGASDVKIGWFFSGNNYSWYVDDVMIIASEVQDIPVLSTLHASGETSDQAFLHGQLLETGNLPITESGFLIGIHPNPSFEDDQVIHLTSGPLMQAGSFQALVTGLESLTNYYARAYVRTENGVRYAGSRKFSTLAALPFSEDFTPPIYKYDMPEFWTAQDDFGGNLWRIHYGWTAIGQDNPCMGLVGFGGDFEGDLISPLIDIKGLESVEVSFINHFYQSGTAAGTLSYDLNENNQWTQVLKIEETSPTDPDTISVTISGLSSSERLSLKWNYSGQNGRWYIDDVQVNDPYGGVSVPEPEVPEMFMVYPNPAGEEFHLHVWGFSGKIMAELIDSRGRIVMKHPPVTVMGNELLSFKVTEVENGIFFLRILSEKGVVTKKVVLTGKK